MIFTPQYWTPSIGGNFMKYSYEYKKRCVELYRQGKWAETPEGVSTDRFHHGSAYQYCENDGRGSAKGNGLPARRFPAGGGFAGQ